MKPFGEEEPGRKCPLVSNIDVTTKGLLLDEEEGAMDQTPEKKQQPPQEANGVISHQQAAENATLHYGETLGGPSFSDTDGDAEMQDAFAAKDEEDDEAWDDDDDDDDVDDWGDLTTDPDEVYRAKKQREEEERLVREYNGENPEGEGMGNGAFGQPAIPPPERRVWMCASCFAMNNMRRFECLNPQCNRVRDVHGDAIMEGKEDDPAEWREQTQSLVWVCSHCGFQNDKSWRTDYNCAMCKMTSEEPMTFYTDEAPQRPPEDAEPQAAPAAPAANPRQAYNYHPHSYGFGDRDDNAAPRRRDFFRPKQHLLGKRLPIAQFPTQLGLQSEPRLQAEFGSPYANRFLRDSPRSWQRAHLYAASITEYQAAQSHECSLFGVDPNKVALEATGSGWLATCHDFANGTIVRVWEPRQDRYAFFTELTIHGHEYAALGKAHARNRVRFVEDRIFLWRKITYSLIELRLNNSMHRLGIVAAHSEKYWRDANTMDVDITKRHLVIMFDRWLGVYHRRRDVGFQWFHAVAFAQRSVRCEGFSLIGADPEAPEEKDEWIPDVSGSPDHPARQGHLNYAYVCAERALVAVHMANSTFEYVGFSRHVRSPSGHHPAFCVSRQYGAFYLSEDKKTLIQSAEANPDVLEEVLHAGHTESRDRVSSFRPDFVDLSKYENIRGLLYDETFGVSGRLLVFGETQQKGLNAFDALFNMDDLKPLYEELQTANYGHEPGEFNTVVSVYEYLYGDRLIEEIVGAADFNPGVMHHILANAKRGEEEEDSDCMIVDVEQDADQKDEWVAIPVPGAPEADEN